ncbi:Tar ligand binding domain-containing protein, partial [Pantoea sp. AS-PWVM4]|uniref:Tar ligand binding domain-containing protein n=1 Tax=Pantoea sp. AS-PWVM4 TaxID=1332069 RepID=UPI000567676B
MFTKIRVVTSLLLVLLIFGFLQLASGSLFFKALSDDKTSFNVAQLASKNIAAINDAYMSLNQSRVLLTRIMLRVANSKLSGETADLTSLYDQSKGFQDNATANYQLFKNTPDTPGQDAQLNKHLDETFSAYASALSQMQDALQANDIEKAGKLPVAPTQSAFLKDYTQWRADQDRLTEAGVEANISAYTRMMWLLGIVMAVVVAVIVLCWFGLRKVLINPLNSNIRHIQHIAQGDLTQTIAIEGRNEMSQLASNLH